ncbi:MAG: glutathione peroxidase [Chitinophagaceae bacterium]|nr:glutathione peroxidase [Chitinophagaceae bacterium]
MNIFSVILAVLINTSFYTLQFQDIDDNIVSMNQFAGKKILLVNIATGSARVNQLSGLQQLHQQYGDSVVVIGFPSNSFSHEPLSNAEIKQYCQSNYGVTFLLASKNPIAGIVAQPVYHWLTNSSENGAMNDPVKSDFQKFLISKEGELIGVFSPSLDPMCMEIQNAIENN